MTRRYPEHACVHPRPPSIVWRTCKRVPVVRYEHHGNPAEPLTIGTRYVMESFDHGQISSGIMASLEQAWGENSIYTVGLDLEVADGYLKEFQQADIGSPTRPQGLHYDYDVFSIMAAPFAQPDPDRQLPGCHRTPAR